MTFIANGMASTCRPHLDTGGKVYEKFTARHEIRSHTRRTDQKTQSHVNIIPMLRRTWGSMTLRSWGLWWWRELKYSARTENRSTTVVL